MKLQLYYGVLFSEMDKWDIGPFKYKLMPHNEVRDEWIRYKRQFEYLALANGVTNKTRLKHIFLARAGPDVQDVFSTLPGADVEERLGVDPFKVMLCISVLVFDELTI